MGTDIKININLHLYKQAQTESIGQKKQMLILTISSQKNALANIIRIIVREGTVWQFHKQPYSISCWEFDTTFTSVWKM